jgi:hypothetical protein
MFVVFVTAPISVAATYSHTVVACTVFDIARAVETKLPEIMTYPANPESWRLLHVFLKGKSARGCRVSLQFREALTRHANSNKNTTPVGDEDATRNMRAWCRTRAGVSRQVVTRGSSCRCKCYVSVRACIMFMLRRIVCACDVVVAVSMSLHMRVRM